MFTSRAEYRLMLREDNADQRLTPKGRELGVVDDTRWAVFSLKQEGIDCELKRLKTTWVQPGTERAARINPLLEKPISREYSLADLLARPDVRYQQLCAASACADEIADPAVLAQIGEQVEIHIKYRGYIERQDEDVRKLRRQENTPLPADFDYQAMQGLSNELKQKLSAARPDSIARASRIPGMTPAAISLLLIYLKKYQIVQKQSA
jgi:tRNA uridine 5-carboxymethylaminomethyl modification enzyme